MMRAAAALLATLVVVATGAMAQDMPDPSAIHGLAIPAPELQAGTVTVRVVREAIGNDLPDQAVSLTMGGTTVTATTDAQGRAEFPGLPGGASAVATAEVDGESLVSQPFAVPTTGGLRVILVAGLAEAAARRAREAAAEAAAPPVSGAVVLGGNSRVLMQLEEEALQVFYLLEIINSARAPVDTGGPLIIDLPRGAGGASVLEGSTPLASVSGDRLTVRGPFASGTTRVNVGYRLRYDSREFRFRQAWPAPLQHVMVAVEQVGGVHVSSPHFEATNEIRSDEGRQFVLATGPALAAGMPLDVTLANLPLHSRTPRWVALGLAVGLGVLGTWLAATGRRSVVAQAQTLVSRREALLEEAARLEVQYRAGSIERLRYERKRERLLEELERIYAELDNRQVPAAGGGTGVAA